MSMAAERVECYSGHTYAQEPRVVVWQEQRHPVVRIEQRWRTPEGPSFRVRTESGAVFGLSYDELQDRWTVNRLSEFMTAEPYEEVET
jgi:hypothetical protein